MDLHSPDSFTVSLFIPTETSVEDEIRKATITWGRKAPTQPWGPNRAVIELHDPDRDFDPINADGPHYGNLNPGARILLRVSQGSDRLDFEGAITAITPQYYGHDSIGITVIEAIDLTGLTHQPVTWSANHLFMSKLGLGVPGAFYSFTADQINTTNGLVKDQSLNEETGIGYEATVAGFTSNAAGDGITLTQATGDYVEMPSLTFKDMIRSKGICAVFSVECTAATGLTGTDEYEIHPLYTLWANTATLDGWSVFVRETRAGTSPTFSTAGTNAMHIVLETYVNGSVSKTKTLAVGDRDDWIDERRAVIVGMDQDTITLSACVPVDGSGTINGATSQTTTYTGEDLTAVAADTNTDPTHRLSTVGAMRSSIPTTWHPENFRGDIHVAGVAHVAGEADWVARMRDSIIERGLDLPGVSDRATAIAEGLDMPTGVETTWYDLTLDNDIPLAQATATTIEQTGLALFQELTGVEQGRFYLGSDSRARVQIENFEAAQARSAVSQAIYTDQTDGLDPTYSTINLGLDTIINSVEVTTPNGHIASATDATSITAHGLQGRRWRLPFADNDDADTFAASVVERYKDPYVRISPIVVRGPTQTWWDEIAAREIGHRVTAHRQPLKTGSTTVVEQVLEGRELTYDAMSGLWTVNLYLASWEPWRPDFDYHSSAPPTVAGYTSNSGAAGNLRLTKPDGVNPGDLLVMILASDSTAGSGGTPWGPVTGWTTDDDIGDTSSDCHVSLIWRVATGAEGASQVVAFNNAATSNNVAGYYLRIVGSDQTTPWHQEGTEVIQGTNSASVTATAVTTTVADCLGLCVVVGDGADATSFTATGTNWADSTGAEITSGSGTTGVSLAWRTIQHPTAGTTADCTITQNGGTNMTWAGSQWAIAPET